jgi:hypothetical protein
MKFEKISPERYYIDVEMKSTSKKTNNGKITHYNGGKLLGYQEITTNGWECYQRIKQ